MIDQLQELHFVWPVIISIIFLVVWAVRQEGRINMLYAHRAEDRAHLNELAIKHENLDSKVLQELSSVRESLARIEGRLSIKKDRVDG